MTFTSQGFGNIEATHAAKFLLFLKEEKLMGLHGKLSANLVVVVNYNIFNAMLVQLFTNRKPCRTGSNNNNLCFIHPYRIILFIINNRWRIIFGYFLNLFYPVNCCNTDAFDLPINQHFAGATFPNAAFEAALTIFEAVAVHRKSGLVQRGSDRKTFFAVNRLSVKPEILFFACANIKNWVFFNLVH